jgi:hypothetical protein
LHDSEDSFEVDRRPVLLVEGYLPEHGEEGPEVLPVILRGTDLRLSVITELT